MNTRTKGKIHAMAGSCCMYVYLKCECPQHGKDVSLEGHRLTNLKEGDEQREKLQEN